MIGLSDSEGSIFKIDLQSVALCLHLEPLLSLADGGRITMSCSKKQAKGIFALKFSEF